MQKVRGLKKKKSNVKKRTRLIFLQILSSVMYGF